MSTASLRTLFDGFLAQDTHLFELVTALPDAALAVERFHGREAVAELFRFEIDCVSTNATSN
jgi:type VI secretion system secreted protein VgrG